MTGAAVDPTNNSWYKRNEPVTVTISGGLKSSTTIDLKTGQIPVGSSPNCIGTWEEQQLCVF